MNKTQTVLGAIVTASALTLSACGGDSDGASSDALVVAVQPYAQLAPTHIAVDEGLFKDEGLDVKLLDSTGGGSSVVAGLTAGDIDFAYTSWASFLQAAAQHLPLVAVRANDRGTEDQGGLFIMPDSGVKSVADLAGQPVGVSLGGTQEVTTRSLLADADVADGDIDLVNTPQSNMVAALTSGKLKAGWLAEPFMTIAEDQGAVELSSAFVGATDNVPLGVWIARKDFVSENADEVKGFVAALDKSIEVAINDRTKVDDSILGYTEIDPKVVKAMRPVDYVEEADDYAGLDRLQDLMVTIGLIPGAMPDDELVATP